MAYGATGGMAAQNPGPFDGSMTDGPMEDHDESTPHKDEDIYEGATGILPKSLMAGKDFKVGEEIVLQITRIGENDFEVKYASEKGGGEKEEMPSEVDDLGKSDRYRTEMGTMME